MKKLVICAFCYNDSEHVRFVLKNALEGYKKFGIDVYYYDSSDNNIIEDIIKKYQDQGYDNLYYIKFDQPVVNKISYFFLGHGLQDEYEYYWPIKARAYLPEEYLPELMSALDNVYDLIHINHYHIFSETSMTKDICMFYSHYGWAATSLDISIYRKASMLSDISSSEDMFTPTKDPLMSYFHFYLMFSKLASINEPKIYIYNACMENAPMYTLRYEDDIFHIWKDDWIAVNDMLPDIYSPYKDKVIKEAAGKPWLIAYIPRLIQLHEKGILVPETLEDVLKNWRRISDIPRRTVEDIAYGNYQYDIHDVSLLFPEYDNSEIKTYIKLWQYLKNRQITPNELPVDEIADLLTKRVMERFSKKIRILSGIVSAGSINDLARYMTSPERTSDEAANALQLMIIILGLTHEDYNT